MQPSPASQAPPATPDPGVPPRELYLREALRLLPKLVVMLDTNPYRPTYGSFDREYWHYRTADFPCAMHQASVLPLTLFYLTDHPRNPLHERPRVREWILAALDFSRRSSNRDGSGDDYYPRERALGATAFSLFSMTESYLRLGLEDPRLLEFFRTRARWIARHREPGNISNHQALAALCLQNVFLLTGEEAWRQAARERIAALIAAQCSEGWFPEYDGCDPGYNTWTIDFLAKYHQKSGDAAVWPAIEAAVSFTRFLIDPQGGIGGVLSSRDSSNFYPHGFEVLAPRMPEAAWIADRFLRGLERGTHAVFDDDRVFHHHLENYLLAYHSSVRSAAAPEPEGDFQRFFAQAGLYAARAGEHSLYLSLKKGGAFRLFRGDRCLRTEAGYIARTAGGRVIVSNIPDDEREYAVQGAEARVTGSFHHVSFPYASPAKLILFRALLLATGFSPLLARWTKALLQRVLVLRKKTAPLRFERVFSFGAGLKVRDRLWADGPLRLERLSAGSDLAVRYTAIGEVFHPSRLEEWLSFPEAVEGLRRDGEVTLSREYA